MDRSKSSNKTKRMEQTAEAPALVQDSGREGGRSRNVPSTGAEAVEDGESRRQRIAERAYDLYEQDGRQDGKDVQHWLDAEHDLAARGISDPDTDGTRLT